MAFLAFAFVAGIVAYGVVVARIGPARRRDPRLWSVLSAGVLAFSCLFLAAYLVPESFDRSLDVDLFRILEAPLERKPKYASFYAVSYAGTSFGILAGIHRLLFAKTIPNTEVKWRLTNRSSGRVRDKVPSSHGRRARRSAQPLGGWRDLVPDSKEKRDAMSFRQLVSWAWRETPPVHKSGTNLLIHLIAVPMFVAGHVLLIVGVLLWWWLVAIALASIVGSLILQGVGHSLERQQVPPFTGPRDFLRRLYAEQFCNFWRFLGSGQWHAHFRSRHNERGASNA